MEPSGNPTILPRSQHPISRKNIDPDVLKVMYRLKRYGYLTYLVGGCVRDFLLGRLPRDFDLGTDARPNQVKKLFRNCYLVGRRFRLAHIRFQENKVVEVATFRRQPHSEEEIADETQKDARYRRENIFGTPEEDAWRRDFTVNALFYDLATFAVIDYVGGLQDLESRVVRTIGNPDERFAEDPVRMLRALEFAARLNFTLASVDREAILRQAPLIALASPARLWEEILALFRYGVSASVLQDAYEMGLFFHIFPGFEEDDRLWRLLKKLDEKTLQGLPHEEPSVLASLCLPSLFSHFPRQGAERKELQEVEHFIEKALLPLIQRYPISCRLRRQVREMLGILWQIGQGRGKGSERLVRREAFPHALELFELWCLVIGQDAEIADFWRQTYEEPPVKKRKRGRREGRRPRLP